MYLTSGNLKEAHNLLKSLHEYYVEKIKVQSDYSTILFGNLLPLFLPTIENASDEEFRADALKLLLAFVKESKFFNFAWNSAQSQHLKTAISKHQSVHPELIKEIIEQL